jgi:hypothetical protein
MTNVYKYRFWCNDCNDYVYTWEEEGVTPTKCPVDTSHSVDLTDLTIVEENLEDTVTIKEEDTPTGGHFQSKTFELEIDTTVGPHKLEMSLPYPVNLLGAYFTNTPEMLGDTARFEMGPDTIIGAVTSPVSVGDRTFTASDTVFEHLAVGFEVKLSDGSNVTNLGIVTSINKTDKTFTTENESTLAFDLSNTVYVLQTVVMIPYVKFPSSGVYKIGQMKIGGSYIPANTTMRILYYNNSENAKTFTINFEYLY